MDIPTRDKTKAVFYLRHPTGAIMGHGFVDLETKAVTFNAPGLGKTRIYSDLETFESDLKARYYFFEIIWNDN